MTGGGIYAVNKLAKTTERHFEQRPQGQPSNKGQQYGPNHPPQGYWGPPPLGQSRDGVAHWYPAPDRNSATPRTLPIDNERSVPKYDYPYESFNERDTQTPPTYAQQPQSYLVAEEQDYGQTSRRRSPLSIAGEMAMDYVQNGKLGKGKKSGKEGAGKVFTQLFK